MSFTAARLGSAPVTVDWSNLKLSSPSSDGIALRDCWTTKLQPALKSRAGFYESPVQEEISGGSKVRELATRFPGSQVKDFIFVGVGPSSLAAKALLSIPGHLKKEANCRVHFLSEPDPAVISPLLSQARPESSWVCIGPGSALETSALALVFLEWLGKSRWKERLVGFPSRAQRELLTFLQAQEVTCLPCPEEISGSTSLFSPPVLFALAVAGYPVEEFLLGAKQVRDHLEKAPPEKSPLLLAAHECIRHLGQRRVHCFYPFDSALEQWSRWGCALWSEWVPAATPVFSQQSPGGLDDKITFFIRAEQSQESVKIPRIPPSAGNLPSSEFRLAEGGTLEAFRTAEYRAHVRLMSRRGRPSLAFQMDRLDARSLGALSFAFCFLAQSIGILTESEVHSQVRAVSEEREALLKEALELDRASEVRDEEDSENSPVNRLRRDSLQ